MGGLISIGGSIICVSEIIYIRNRSSWCTVVFRNGNECMIDASLDEVEKALRASMPGERL